LVEQFLIEYNFRANLNQRLGGLPLQRNQFKVSRKCIIFLSTFTQSSFKPCISLADLLQMEADGSDKSSSSSSGTSSADSSDAQATLSQSYPSASNLLYGDQGGFSGLSNSVEDSSLNSFGGSQVAHQLLSIDVIGFSKHFF
jgi:hypothetical protein